MERARAAPGGLAVAVLILVGFVAVRLATLFLHAVVWFAETVALFAFAAPVGYLTYRVFWGVSDDPRRL